MGGTATPADRKEFYERQTAVIGTILKITIDELFIIREITPEIPVREKIFTSVQCASCGEMVAEHRARVRDRKFICMPCAGEYGKGW